MCRRAPKNVQQQRALQLCNVYLRLCENMPALQGASRQSGPASLAAPG